MTQVTPKHQGRREIYALLEKCLKRQLDTKEWFYIDGYSDMKVATEVLIAHPESEVITGMVQGIRGRSWGKLYVVPVKTAAQEMAELRAEVAELRSKLEDKDSSSPTSEEMFKPTIVKE